MALTVTRERILAAGLLGLMLALMLASAWDDSAVMDELAHVPAGYANLFLRDYRLNPEHPPLAKMLAALPLAFTGVRFPTDVPSWTQDVNGQWAQGAIFLYEAGNDAERILRLMRLAGMGLAVLFGWLLWRWVRRHFGERVALLTLFLFALSPTFLAHSRYVTTDLAAAFAFFIGVTAFLKFLANPSGRNVLLAGFAFGLAELLKFSLILLVPLYGLLLIAWAAAKVHLAWRDRIRLLALTLPKTLAIAAIGVAVIWIAYAYAVWNYPQDRQLRDAEFILASFGNRPLAEFDLRLIGHDFTRPIGHYLLGLLMVIQRSAGGNTQYFWGEVSAAGNRLYFPLLYLFKEPLALHILTAIALAFATRRVLRAPLRSPATALLWIRDHFAEFAAMVFIVVYWASSVSSTLNIGVRHVLPTFPFIYLLVSREIVAWLRPWRGERVGNRWQQLLRFYRIHIASLPRYLAVSGLLAWQAASVIIAYPYFLPYYNALGGGTAGGWRIAVDSNYDWGQDLKRLASFAAAHGIPQIAVDYFGGGSPRYYLGEKFEPWSSARGYPSGIGWFAVSATFQMGAYGEPVKGFIRRPEDSYEWLKPFRPMARAGKSIFIYQLPEKSPEFSAN